MIKFFPGKLKSTRGESITESLVSMLIIVLAMTMLAGSIVSAARVNDQVREYDTSFRIYDASTGTESDGTVTLTHGGSTTTPETIEVNVFQTNTNDEDAQVQYIYYEKE